MPLTVFVTALRWSMNYAQFEANALDYLLKPFSDERFEVTMARVSIRMDDAACGSLDRRILAWFPRRPRRICR